MLIEPIDKEHGRLLSSDGTGETGIDETTRVHSEPTTAEMAAKIEANTKTTERTQVVDPSFGKGSIVNDMA